MKKILTFITIIFTITLLLPTTVAALTCAPTLDTAYLLYKDGAILDGFTIAHYYSGVGDGCGMRPSVEREYEYALLRVMDVDNGERLNRNGIYTFEYLENRPCITCRNRLGDIEYLGTPEEVGSIDDLYNQEKRIILVGQIQGYLFLGMILSPAIIMAAAALLIAFKPPQGISKRKSLHVSIVLVLLVLAGAYIYAFHFITSSMWY